jgi:calcium-dependent protein kinase
MWQMLSGIAYLHHHGFVHRDVKLESYLLKSRSEDAQLKLTDFGLACRIESGVPLTEPLGTPAFMAPEVMRGSYNSKVDVYGIGVCSFYLATARLPCRSEAKENAGEQALADELCSMATASEWADVPQELRSLLRELLTADPIMRPSARDVLERKNSWLREHGYDPSEKMDPAGGPGRHDKACCTIS